MNAKTIAYICNHKDGHVKLFMEAPASPMWEVSELVLRHEAETQIDVLKAENAELHAECDRLTALLQWEQGHRERIGTHGDECWKCVGTGRVLGSGLYNYEPCPLCRPIERAEWEGEQKEPK